MIGNRRTARRAFWPALFCGVALGCSSPVPNNPQVTPSDRILVAVAPASASASIRRLEELLKLRDLKYEIVSRGKYEIYTTREEAPWVRLVIEYQSEQLPGIVPVGAR
jgi:hypothetical protein